MKCFIMLFFSEGELEPTLPTLNVTGARVSGASARMGGSNGRMKGGRVVGETQAGSVCLACLPPPPSSLPTITAVIYTINARCKKKLVSLEKVPTLGAL